MDEFHTGTATIIFLKLINHHMKCEQRFSSEFLFIEVKMYHCNFEFAYNNDRFRMFILETFGFQLQ